MRTLAVGAAAGLVLAGLWLAIYPPLPQSPTGDVFTSLAVARHLDRGEGLLNDTVYPLFTAYPWGRELPQPLLHRPPGLAVLLLPAWWLAGGDPARAERLVGPVMLAVLALTAALGAAALRRCGALPAAGAWLLLLLVNPLLALGVRWGWGEVPAGLLLFALWLVLRRRPPAVMSARTTVLFAALAAGLALVRQDLLWVPVLWWFAGAAALARRPRRLLLRSALAALVGLVLLLPWWLHVARHAGSPLANPLAEAVQLDLDEAWWEYPLLRGRTPVPLGENLTRNAGPALRKVRTGVRQFAQSLGHWLPWLAWITFATLGAAAWRRRRRRGHRPLAALGPAGLLAVTIGLAVLQYALFSAETRHLLPLLPLVAWQTVLLGEHALRRRLPGSGRRAALLTVATGAALLATPPQLGGEEANVALAVASVARVQRSVAAAADLPPGPVFADTAILPWRLDRPFVWSPLDAAIEAEIRAAVPAMREAPWVRLDAGAAVD